MVEPAEPLPQVALSPGYDSRYPHRGHYARNCAIAVAAFAGCCAIIHALLPFPEIPDVTSKLRYFTAHKDEFDTIFVGSSHVYRDIVPVIFDGVTAAKGIPTRSFNLALGGMQPPESLYFLEQALRARPANLRWVFLEFQEVQPKWPREKRHTQRFSYWHNWRFTRAAIESAINAERHRRWWEILWLGGRSRTVGSHFTVFFKNMVNLGAASNFQDWTWWRRESGAPNEQFDRLRGYEPLNHRMSTAQAGKYLEQLQRRSGHAGSRPINLVTEETYRQSAGVIKANGAAPVYLLTPGANLMELRFRDGDPSAGPVLVFNQAGKYRNLYDPALRADEEHLSPEGAEIFTRLLAERFATELVSGSRR